MQSTYTQQQLVGVGRTLLEAVIFTGIVMLFFLRSWRNAIVVLIAIPSSLLVTLGAMKLAHFTLDTVSLLAMTLIIGILVVSIVSRVGRSFPLRATSVTFDVTALDFILEDAEEGEIRIISHEPDVDTTKEYEQKNKDERKFSHIPQRSRTIFLEVFPSDSSDFEEDLVVHGVVKFGYRVLQVKSGNVPNTIASVLLEIRDITGVVPTIYFEWTEGNPISNMFRYLITGVGEVAPVTREVLREAEKDVKRRPAVHVS